MRIAESFRALSDPLRRQALLLLRDGRLAAGALAQKLGVSPAVLSYHLGLLKKADLVVEYREKNFVYYELNSTVFEEMILWMGQFGGTGHEKSGK